MKPAIFSLLLSISCSVFSQSDICSFKITDYMVNSGDSLVVVQLRLGDAAAIKQNQVGLLRGNYSNGDTSEIGWGRCHLIKGDYYYFGIHIKNKKHLPKAGDLIYTTFENKVTWKGLFYKLMCHSVHFQRVTEGSFISENEILLLNKKKEDSLMTVLAEDIKFTGTEMLKQNNNQDQKITGGRFDGKTLFATMQKIESKDVSDFLKYMIARPRNYAGNNWKISEVFATWIVSGTPAVIE